MKLKQVSDGHSHTIGKEGRKHKWYVRRLWQLAKDLPQFEFEIASFKGFIQNQTRSFDLKRKTTGLSPTDYRAIKSEFIVKVLGR
jgi:hypothetical protein